MDGAEYAARIVVQEVQDGRRFYDHELSSIESARPASTSGGSASASASRQSELRPLASPVGSLTRGALAVNPSTVSKVVDPQTGGPMVV